MIRKTAPLCRAVAVVVGVLVPGAGAWGTDIYDVQPAALDQPRINAYISLTPEGEPESFEGTFNISAFFDTGASGILLSNNTAGFLGITPDTFDGQTIVYKDVGVAGTSDFHVSRPIHIGLAPYHPNTDVDNRNTYRQVYNQTFSGVRAHVGPINIPSGEQNPVLADLDVFGMPLMQGKVVVMDPQPVDTFADTMRTYVYNPGTPFDAENAATNPGIPQVSRHVKLSYGNFERFTTTEPAGAPAPSLIHNPFIGPNPVLRLDPDAPAGDTPPVKIGYDGKSTTGSFLLDTGAAASIISTELAGRLGVRYQTPAEGYDPDNPELVGVPTTEQFQLTVGGIGGTKKITGFYLDSFLMKSMEGDANDDADEAHFNFLGAPVLVLDIAVKDPTDGSTLTLDGIFGMNFLVATAYVSEAEPFPIIDNLTRGNFKWAVFDEVNGTLGLEYQEKIGSGDVIWRGWETGPVDEWRVGVVNFQRGSEYAAYEEGDAVVFEDFVFDTEALRVYIPEPVAPGGVRFKVDFDADYLLYGPGKITGFTGLIKTGPRTLTVSTGNDYTGITSVAGGKVIFTVPQDIGAMEVGGGAAAEFRTGSRLKGKLTVRSDGRVGVARGGTNNLVVRDVEAQGTGTIDLADNAMTVLALSTEIDATLGRIHDLIRSGRNGGAWDGAGLTSGAAAADPTGLTTLIAIINDDGGGRPVHDEFFGQDVDANDVLVKYTWAGDLNLDGRVGLDDYALMDESFLDGSSPYPRGDLDYDGQVDIDDYYLIDAAFLNQTGTFPVMPAEAAAVPEPAALGLLAAAGLATLRRRRGGKAISRVE